MTLEENGNFNPLHYEVNESSNGLNSNFRHLSNYPNTHNENINKNSFSKSNNRECSTFSNQRNNIQNIEDKTHMTKEKLHSLRSDDYMRNNIYNKDVDRSFIGNNNNKHMSPITNHLTNSDEDWDYSKNFQEVIPINNKENDEDIKNESLPVRLGKVKSVRENHD